MFSSFLFGLTGPFRVKRTVQQMAVAGNRLAMRVNGQVQKYRG